MDITLSSSFTNTRFQEKNKVSYPRFCCDIRSQKEETHRVRMTVGGDRLDYAGNTATEV